MCLSWQRRKKAKTLAELKSDQESSQSCFQVMGVATEYVDYETLMTSRVMMGWWEYLHLCAIKEAKEVVSQNRFENASWSSLAMK